MSILHLETLQHYIKTENLQEFTFIKNDTSECPKIILNFNRANYETNYIWAMEYREHFRRLHSTIFELLLQANQINSVEFPIFVFLYQTSLNFLVTGLLYSLFHG